MIFFLLHWFVPTQSAYSYSLSIWPTLRTTVSQGHCKWLNLHRQFTCLLVLIQTDEGGRLCTSVCMWECWWERKMERQSAWFCHFVSIYVCASWWVCVAYVIVVRSAKVRTFLPRISDELRSSRELLVFTWGDYKCVENEPGVISLWCLLCTVILSEQGMLSVFRCYTLILTTLLIVF